eukprot:CAMPEP_0171337456 /NCGR_PEP_ID=MMETSP0878-20121228/6694_1 /TAXON_ID=67004 /ORGANISM="Thalassiosira weissflogii, Strain CCMP1336" /LENGTH=475 /DNA_ID=CAMNT_0011839077 /DNA_START=8 /DNA_END=1432 /DNA_ORIENTATION=-
MNKHILPPHHPNTPTCRLRTIPPLLKLLTLSQLLLLLPTPNQSANLSNCKGGCPLGELCIGNPFSQPVSDSECSPCAMGQYWWPCNFETLCFCNDIDNGGARIPPAPLSGEKVNDAIQLCEDDSTTDNVTVILTREMFDQIVKVNSTEDPQQSPSLQDVFGYGGFCAAVSQYNQNHDEKFAGMGTDEQIRREVAAFLAHVAADSFGFSTIREDHHCVDPVVGSDGITYCKPCKEEHYDKETKVCSQAYLATETSYTEFCDETRQGQQGCDCRNVTAAPVPLANGAIDVSGYIPAHSAYFTRGAIALSWNYDYYGASMALTGSASALCDSPDVVATNSQYFWGAGIYKWMEKMQFGTTGSTAHRQIMKGNFGGTVEVLYGELECPASQWTSLVHVGMVKERIAHVCNAGAVLGVYIEMDQCDVPIDCVECKELKDLYEQCKADGTCAACATWTDFVRSSAPTVAPLRVQPPSWDDW